MLRLNNNEPSSCPPPGLEQPPAAAGHRAGRVPNGFLSCLPASGVGKRVRGSGDLFLSSQVPESYKQSLVSKSLNFSPTPEEGGGRLSALSARGPQAGGPRDHGELPTKRPAEAPFPFMFHFSISLQNFRGSPPNTLLALKSLLTVRVWGTPV